MTPYHLTLNEIMLCWNTITALASSTLPDSKVPLHGSLKGSHVKWRKKYVCWKKVPFVYCATEENATQPFNKMENNKLQNVDYEGQHAWRCRDTNALQELYSSTSFQNSL